MQRRVRMEVPLLLGFAALAGGPVFTGARCSGSQSPVDTSQMMLIEAGTALADIDQVVADRVRGISEGAIDRAVTMVRSGHCNTGEQETDCVVRHVREYMSLWYQLTAALEAARGTLEAWQAANDGWRNSGNRPQDWESRVCTPVRLMANQIVELLSQVEVVVPEGWAGLVMRAEKLCTLGVAVAEVAGAAQEQEATQ